MNDKTLENMGFLDGEYTLKDGAVISANGIINGIFTLYTPSGDIYNLSIYNKFELEQFLKIMGE